jgi:hypothetical protein
MTFSFMPCPECGVPVPAERFADHECRYEQWVDHQVARAKDELSRIESEVASYLETAEGRFAAWYAERTRLCAA